MSRTSTFHIPPDAELADATPPEAPVAIRLPQRTAVRRRFYIHTPAGGDAVQYPLLVKGHVQDDRLVQVLVQARDGRWYLQAPVHRGANGTFAVWAYCGFADGPGGGEYVIVALHPDQKITESPLAELPPGLATRQVRVRRES